jgi:hypothetical protein
VIGIEFVLRERLVSQSELDWNIIQPARRFPTGYVPTRILPTPTSCGNGSPPASANIWPIKGAISAGASSSRA